jgi:hypothetical protein
MRLSLEYRRVWDQVSPLQTTQAGVEPGQTELKAETGLSLGRGLSHPFSEGEGALWATVAWLPYAALVKEVAP